MKIAEFLKQDIDIDVVDDVTEDLYIAYVGPMTLTAEGKSKFNDVLDCEIELSDDIGIVKVSHYDDWVHKLNLAKKLFHSAAGYCSISDYDNWFQS